MYNTNIPTRAELPSSAQLMRSTMIASAIALTALVTVVMPSEYAVDPTGVGGLLGLTDMGKIKTSLAAEARAEELAANAPGGGVDPAQVTRIEQRLESIEASLKGFMEANAVATPFDQTRLPEKEAPVEEQAERPAEIDPAQDVVAAEQAAADQFETAAIPEEKSDRVELTLEPGQGAEVKMLMKEGEKAQYSWTANGGLLNFDVHGEGQNEKASYDKGRMVPEYKGSIEAAFDGKHGWFWRNRTEKPVTMTLVTKGAYSEIVRVK